MAPLQRSRPVLRLLLIGLVFHLVYIGTVFDCYFTSPVINGMRSHGLGKGPAKRLVLIVGDGLRADLLFNKEPFPMTPGSPDVVAPFLRSVAETKGAFGISHTHVPTESRPGHVALIGGMYEDVSAVTKGWKTNPVDFDSVFNRSSHTFSFGSPDILPMFAHGATPGKVDMWMYHEDEEDFTKDATALDTWVVHHLRSLLHNASSDPVLDGVLRKDQTVFFLHLLGLDTTGHSYRPHSKEYMTNIQVVDEIARQTNMLMSEFFNDNGTAFIFTADHGMSQIGNHGDGDPDNTRTPLIAWGAGIRGPLPDTKPSSHDDYSAPWDLSHLFRRDVEQADVAALMSTLIGIDWPVNSVGVLPDVDHTRPGYLLDVDGGKTQANAALVNAKVILEHYRLKHEQKRQHALFYKQYEYFTQHGLSEAAPGEALLTSIEALLAKGSYNEARALSAELINHTLEGLRYLQTYDRTLIGAMVVVAYLGWIAYGAIAVLNIPPPPKPKVTVWTVSLTSLLLSWSLFAVQRSPVTFYLYVTFPVYFWYQVLSQIDIPKLFTKTQSQSTFISKLLRFAVSGIVVVAILQSMVVAYTHRFIWSIGFVCIGIVWPLAFWPREFFSRDMGLLAGWATVCLVTAVFPLLDVNKQESIPTIIAGGICMLFAGIFCAHRISRPMPLAHQRRYQMCALLVISIFVTSSSASNLQEKLGLPVVNQVVGWVVLAVASIFPFIYRPLRPPPQAKILTLFLGFAVCFVILSISNEGLFYFFYTATLTVWTEVEAKLRSYSRSSAEKHGTRQDDDGGVYTPRADDLRIAVFFLFFVQVAFFGTGNVASISSFYLEPVYRLVPIFSPFLMAALLIFKIVAPYIILAASFAWLNARLELPPFSLFLVALTLTDVMTMTFFFKVTDTGSWLEIGQSISHFCVSSLLLVWSAGICAVGESLMASTSMSFSSESTQRGKEE
ncbi:PigN-domain-containing protein [Panus rudis PR-1116 ss-1]|nr:PigN-domain-containing protein [Panus rudis PR-1116 ss-1]